MNYQVWKVIKDNKNDKIFSVSSHIVSRQSLNKTTYIERRDTHTYTITLLITICKNNNGGQ